MTDFVKVEELVAKLKTLEQEKEDTEHELSAILSGKSSVERPKQEERGRPKQNGHKQRPPVKENKERKEQEGTMKSVIKDILKHRKNGLKLPDLTEAVLEKYDTKAKNPSNVVYQNVHSLVKDGDIVRKDDRAFAIVN